MKKEVIIAVIVGFSLGLIITFGIYRAQKSLKEIKTENTTQESLLPDGNNNISLSITQPEDGSITDEDTVTIGGITKKNSLVTLISPQDHQAIQADELGNFSVEFSLDAGENQIHITSVSENGTKQEKDMSIVYTTYEFEEDETNE